MAQLSMAELAVMQDGMTDQQKLMFMTLYTAEKKDRTIALILSIFLGYIGIDRFYAGDIGLGILKLLTAGACGIWTIIDWFLIMGRIDEYNRVKAQGITVTIRGMR